MMVVFPVHRLLREAEPFARQVAPQTLANFQIRSQSWNTGIPIVDEQHRSLVRQVSDLVDKSRADRVEETLGFLSDYVIMHFARKN